MGDCEGALAALIDVLGEEHVVTDQDLLDQLATTTYPTDTRISAIAHPGSVEQLQECVKLANHYKTPIYPISTGMNFGYGAKSPTFDGAIIIGLSRLNKIRHFSKELAYVTVEPGVTQRQLFHFLHEQDSNLWMDATGGPADHSLIGNIVERGFGHTSKADHFSHSAGLEVVLPNGELIKTGFGRFPNAVATDVYRWGVGPSFDGLFTQSNYGIVTAVTIWLMPAPDYYQSFYFSIDEEAGLADLIDLLRPLKLNGTIPSAMHIGNDYKVLSSVGRYPWREAEGKTPLSKEILAELAKAWDFGAWNVSGAIYGSKAEVKDARRRIKRAVKGKVKKLRFLDENGLAVAERIQWPYYRLTGKNLPEMLKILRPLFGLIKGEPTDAMLPSVYWRCKGKLPENLLLDEDNVGLYWFAPVAPTQGSAAREIWKITHAVFTKYGFEPIISITTINERAIDVVISLLFDRGTPGADELAAACAQDLLRQLTSAGYYPYRLGTTSMTVMQSSCPEAEKLQRKIKQALDPAGILAPGRYESPFN